MDQAAAALVSAGGLGILALVAIGAAARLWFAYAKASEARVADSQKFLTTVLEIQKASLETQNRLAEAVERLSDRLDAIR